MFINYSTLLKIVLAAVWLSASTVYASENITGSSPANKPNIIFIFADDLGYGDVSSFGATDIKTPNIDQLGKQGIKFTNFYAALIRASGCNTVTVREFLIKFSRFGFI